MREARAAVAPGPAAELGSAHALLAEALNAIRDRGALEAARRATELDPFLVEGWRELGDAHLEASDLKGAETAFRKVVELDTTYGLGYAKLAQVLLEQGRTLEALESITAAADRGGDPFFLAAIRGDIYAEMERHSEAAESYDHALRVEPEDHWALHQAAVEHGYAGHTARAAELFEAALKTRPRRLPPDVGRLRRPPAAHRPHRRRREAVPPSRGGGAGRSRVEADAARRGA